MKTTALAVVFLFPIHKNALFYGWQEEKMAPIHEIAPFRGRESFILLYLHDSLRFLDSLCSLEMTIVILSEVEGSINENTN